MAAAGVVSDPIRNRLHFVNGVLVPKYIQQEEVDRLRKMELYPDDVWIVTYPKCGTTWTQQIVRLIRSKGQQDDVKISDAIPMLEAADYSANATTFSRPRAFKSHFPYHALPCGPPHTTPCKYIFVMRNPKDVAVSFYFHTKLYLSYDIEWDTFWKSYVEGQAGFGNYLSDHLLAWWPHRNDKNVLILRYEDMKGDLIQAISKIASFIEVDLCDKMIARIADLTTFENMKQDNTVNYTWKKPFKGEDAPFMRKGEVGDWKNYLTPEQSAQMDTLCAEKFKDTEIMFGFCS